MTANKSLPKKLGKEPLIEAIFEIRFPGGSLVSNRLLGYITTKLDKGLPIKKLPAMDIPEQLRARNVNFKYSPLFQISWGQYAILIGDCMCAVTNGYPYQGWKNFKKAIIDITELLRDCGLINNIERYSLKYVDLVEASTTKEQIASIKLDLRLGGYAVKEEPINLRVELPKKPFLHVVEIVSNAIVAEENKPERNGILINIDSIDNAPPVNFWEVLSENLELIHEANKELFFGFLEKDTLISLEPTYDD